MDEEYIISEELLDLNIDRHIRSVGDFTCGADHPLNDFLCSFASEYMNLRKQISILFPSNLL